MSSLSRVVLRRSRNEGQGRSCVHCGCSSHERALVGLKNDRRRNGPVSERWRVPVTIPRSDLERLVEASTVLLEREKHRLLHASDRARWGRRGGRETVRRYGSSWMALLALHHWGRVSAAELDAARPLR